MYLCAWRKLDTLQDRSKLGPWLCGIVKNIARDSYRRAKRDVMHEAAPLDKAVAQANTAEPFNKTTQSEREAVDGVQFAGKTTMKIDAQDMR